MPKKCLPGVICIENLTLGVLLVIVSIVCYIVYAQTSRPVVNREIQRVTMTPGHLGGIPAKNDVFNDPYAPPAYKCIIGNNIAFTKSTLIQLG